MSNNHNEILNTGETSRVVNVGHGNFVLIDRIVAILSAKGLPMKRLREKAVEENTLVDATQGNKTRSIIITDSKHLFLSSLAPQTLQERFAHGKTAHSTQTEWEEGQFVS